MKRPLTAGKIIEMQHEMIELGGIWKGCIGTMDRHGVVFFWGNSGNGKSSAVVSFCKQLAQYGKVLFVSLEEGYSLSMSRTLDRFDMKSCGSNFQVIDHCTLEELDERLQQRRSPEFIVIDSFQYMQISYRQYLAFKERYPNKLLIFVSHAEGRQPAGRAAKSVMYDAGLKIWVEGYKAFSKGRFIGDLGYAVIWEQGMEEYWAGKQQQL